MRGTHDDGKRIRTLSLTVNRRKLKNLRSVVSHVSNVNHWMLSHDNVWAVLKPDHPALKRSSRGDVAARSSLSHDSKHPHSAPAGTATRARASSSERYSMDASHSAHSGQAGVSGTANGGSSTAPVVREVTDGVIDSATVWHSQWFILSLHATAGPPVTSFHKFSFNSQCSADRWCSSG